MANTIYATFANERDAERAAGALMDHGVDAADVSFIVPEQLKPARTEFAGGLVPTGPDAATPLNAPASQYTAPADIPVTDPQAAIAPTVPSTQYVRPRNIGQEPTEVQPHPGYVFNAAGEEVPASSLNSTSAIPYNIPHTAPISGAPVVPVARTGRVMAADTPLDLVETEPGQHIIDANRNEPAAASGITTTTGKDAAKGAAEGAAIGLGLGLVLGLAAVAIPGIGLVAGTGALVAGLTAATGVAGGIAGGTYGFLTDLGLPPDTARLLENHLNSGGPILSVNITGSVPQGEIIMVLEKYGATSARAF